MFHADQNYSSPHIPEFVTRSSCFINRKPCLYGPRNCTSVVPIVNGALQDCQLSCLTSIWVEPSFILSRFDLVADSAWSSFFVESPEYFSHFSVVSRKLQYLFCQKNTTGLCFLLGVSLVLKIRTRIFISNFFLDSCSRFSKTKIF